MKPFIYVSRINFIFSLIAFLQETSKMMFYATNDIQLFGLTVQFLITVIYFAVCLCVHTAYKNIKNESGVTAAANPSSIELTNRPSAPYQSEFMMEKETYDLPPSYDTLTSNNSQHTINPNKESTIAMSLT